MVWRCIFVQSLSDGETLQQSLTHWCVQMNKMLKSCCPLSFSQCQNDKHPFPCLKPWVFTSLELRNPCDLCLFSRNKIKINGNQPQRHFLQTKQSHVKTEDVWNASCSSEGEKRLHSAGSECCNNYAWKVKYYSITESCASLCMQSISGSQMTLVCTLLTMDWRTWINVAQLNIFAAGWQ